jgi:MFS family permease
MCIDLCILVYSFITRTPTSIYIYRSPRPLIYAKSMVCLSTAILLGYVSNLIFAGLLDHINWRVMLAAGILPSVSIAFVLMVIPESPRWLVMQSRASEARAVLLKVTDSEAEAQERLAEIEEAARIIAASGDKAVWRELLVRPSPVIRRMLVTGVGVQVFQQATGIDALVYYSLTIFRDAGIATERQLLAATVAVGLTKTAFIVVAIVLVDRVGRKPLLYVSTVGITVCLAVLAASLSLLARCLRGRPSRWDPDGVRLRGLLLGGDRGHQHGAELGDLPAASARAGRGHRLRAEQDDQRRRGHVIPLHLRRRVRGGRVHWVRRRLGAVRGVRAPAFAYCNIVVTSSSNTHTSSSTLDFFSLFIKIFLIHIVFIVVHIDQTKPA